MAEEEEKEAKASAEERDEEASEAEEETSAPDEAASSAEPEPGGESEEEEDRLPLTVEVKDEGPCRKTLKVEIPAERVAEDIRKGLEEIRSSVPMPGFRKGRVPAALLARRFGKKVKEDVRANLVSEAVEESLKREDLRPFSTPEFSDDTVEEIKIEEGKPLVFEYSVDVKPEIEVSNYLGLEVERPKVAVSAEEVEKDLGRLMQRRGRLVPVDDGKVQHGDILVVTGEYTYRKKVVHREENETLQIPEKGSDLFKPMPWLKDFLGKKAGDKVERTIKFPEDFKEESLRNRQGRQRWVIEDIKRVVVPEIDEEFLEEMGVGSEADLRSKIETQLQAAKEALADSIVEGRLVDVLLETIPIHLPEGVVEREVDQYMKRYEVRMREQKVPEAQIDDEIEKMRSERRKTVEKEFRAFFLLEEIARKEKIFTTEEEVDQRVEAMAVNYGKWPSQMKEELESAGLMDQVRNQVKEEKVKAFLREKAKVKEGKPLDLEKAMEEEA
ncbi:MAG: trigger factor [Planctomycetota bacterium]|jgi:trigger factor